MNFRAVGVVAGAVVALVLVAAAGLYLGGLAFTSHYHSYDYRVAVATETNLSDVTLYVPVPARDDETLADHYADVAVVEDPPVGWFPDDGPHVPRHTGGAADWNASIVRTADGPMLALRASTVERGTYVFGIATQSEPGRLETADPWTTAFVARPAANVSAVACPGPAPVEETERCYAFDTRVYADYAGPADVTVTLGLLGQDDWTFAMANGWNWFDQRAVAALRGDAPGWVAADGTLRGGRGNYP